MAGEYLGETFDIHGGGIDLLFPHHENEIAQSEGAHHGHPLANVWMHNGFLQVEGEKMSKSLGNFFTIRELLADWPGEVLRFNMLRTHYRQPIDFTFAGLKESWKMLERWYEVTEPLADPRARCRLLRGAVGRSQHPGGHRQPASGGRWRWRAAWAFWASPMCS